MNVFEDAGYFCVDNLPAEMIRSLADLFPHPGSSVERAAIVSDLRGGTYFERLAEVLDELEATGIAHRVLFLRGGRGDADHALQGDPPPPPAGAHRRRRLDGRPARGRAAGPVRERADVLIDTTGHERRGLRRKVAAEMLDPRRPAGWP